MPSTIQLPHHPQERDFSCLAACARMVQLSLAPAEFLQFPCPP